MSAPEGWREGEAWRGRRVCVLGFGRSGQGAAQLLLARGARVRVLEQVLKPEMQAAWDDLASRGGEMIAGPHPPDALDDCALLVRSPGVPGGAPPLGIALQRGIPIISELLLAASYAQGPILAITGTNGKSTTTAWTAHLLRRAGVPAVAAGNIGHALSRAVLEEPPGTHLVAEVSSFQLEDSPTFHPRAAAILNIAPDHLDRHGSFEAYAAAKWAIAAHLGATDLLVLGPDLLAPARIARETRILRCAPEPFAGEDGLFLRGHEIVWRRAAQELSLLPVADLSLPGPHNCLNAMTAIALASAAVSDPRALVPGLTDFGGLPHRLEDAGTIADVRFINDSKATNVESQRVALESFSDPVVLIAGGLDKGGPFEALHDLARRRVRRLVAIGKAAERIRSAWPLVPSETAPDFETALRRALLAARPRGIVLLSPGCASFDMFRDYEDRGEIFKSLVRRLADEARDGGDDGI